MKLITYEFNLKMVKTVNMRAQYDRFDQICSDDIRSRLYHSLLWGKTYDLLEIKFHGSLNQHHEIPI